MNFEQALTFELENIQSIQNRVFPLRATQGVKPPYIVYISSEGYPDKSFEGFLNNKSVPCELNIIHSNYKGLKELTRSLLSKIHNFQGRVIGVEGPFIENITYENPVELYENEINSYRTVLEINFKIKEV